MHHKVAHRVLLNAVLLRLFGTNPWPSTGLVGRLAAVLMTAEALVLLVGYAFASLAGTAGAVSTDFIAYLTAAAMFVNGDGQFLYQPDRQIEAQRALLAAAGVYSPTLITYVNPPLWAAVMALFYPLGVRAGASIWALLNLVVPFWLLMSIAGFQQMDSGPSKGHLTWTRLRCAAISLCFAPFLEAWFFGQMIALMFAAFAGWFLLSRANRPLLAGLALSLILFKPQYAPFMFVFLAWKGQWAQLSGFGIGAAIHVILTPLVLMRDGHLPSIDALLPYVAFGGGQPNVLVELQLNLRGLIWHVLPGVESSIQIALLAIATVAAAAGFCSMVGRDWEPRSRAFAWQALALFAFVPLTAFHNNLLHLYLLLPAMVALLAPGTGESEERPWLGTALSAILIVPSAGILLGMTVSPYLYYGAGWLTAAGALGLGLYAYRITARSGKQAMMTRK